MLSRRAEAIKGKAFTFRVVDGGGATLSIGAATFDIASAFSAPGSPLVWNNLTEKVDGWAVRVDRAHADEGRWTVSASSGDYTLSRRYALDPAPPVAALRVLIDDTLTSTAAELIGISVKHDVRLARGTVDNVQVPGRFEPGMCGTDGPDGNAAIFGYADYEAHSTNFGAPHIWLNTTTGAGLGMVALDDVFRVHAQQRQFAAASLNPRVKMSCPVNDPPSIRLSDPFFGLAPAASHTLEWAVYPFGAVSFLCLRVLHLFMLW